MRDLISNFRFTQLIGPATLAADNTPAAFDLANFDAAMILLGIGVGGITFDDTNKITFELSMSDNGTDYAAVEDEDVLIKLPNGSIGGVAEGGILRTLNAAHAAASLTRIQLLKPKRYGKLLANFQGTHNTGTPLSALLVSGRPSSAPLA